MSSILFGFILISCFILYHNRSLALWSITSFTYLLITYYLNNDAHSYTFLIFILLYSACIIFFNFKFLRQKFLTKFIFIKAKTILPKISETEQLALNAGDTWYEKEIFQGKPDFNLLHDIKKFALSDEEESFLQNETNQLCSMIDDWHITHVEKDLPINLWDFIRKTGFFGLVIAKEYGGKGFSAAAHSNIVMKIATRSVSVAVTVMVPNSLGPGELLYHYGTKEQKDLYLPKLATGEEIPCFALTGPHAGSDATSITDKGTICMGQYNGVEVLGIRLQNVDKRYITLAPVATLVGLAFKVVDPNNLLNGIGRTGITCALLPHDHPGLEIGNRLFALNQVFMNGTVRAKDTFIPMDWVIGGQAMVGEGWRMLVECLSIGRSISLPACGTASALMSTVSTSAYALIREQFKVSIGTFEGVEEKLARMGGLTYMLNATREFTVSAVDNGVRPSVASAIAKYHLTELGRVVITDAMDIHGGRGIIMGPNNYLARGYEGSPVGITVEGANIMTRNLMIFGQGAMRCHPYVRTEYESLMADDGLEQFDNAMFGHIGYHLQNMVRAIFHSFTCGFFANSRNNKFIKYYKQITRMSSYFAYIGDLSLIILGGELKRKERISARLGDVMSYLYMASSTLRYYEANGKIQDDEVFVTWVLDYALFYVQNALIDVLDNFPMKGIAKILKFILFPYGLAYKKPSDTLENKISKGLLRNCKTREMFKDNCFVPNDSGDILGRVELAFKHTLLVAPIKNKIIKAMKAHIIPKGKMADIMQAAYDKNIITNEDLMQLQSSLKLNDEIIQVDEFSAFELGPKNAHPSWH